MVNSNLDVRKLLGLRIVAEEVTPESEAVSTKEGKIDRIGAKTVKIDRIGSKTGKISRIGRKESIGKQV